MLRKRSYGPAPIGPPGAAPRQGTHDPIGTGAVAQGGAEANAQSAARPAEVWREPTVTQMSMAARSVTPTQATPLPASSPEAARPCGSRAPTTTARTLAAEIGRAAVVAVDNRDALQGADAVVLALRFAVLKGVIDEIADPLTDKLVVVPSNPLSVDAQGNASRLLPKGQSSGEVLAGWLPAGARFDSRSARPTFRDLAGMGSRSVTGHCNRSGRDARVILRGASLGDVYDARWWPDWTGTGWRTVTAPVFPDIRINALPEGYSRASAARADAERWPC